MPPETEEKVPNCLSSGFPWPQFLVPFLSQKWKVRKGYWIPSFSREVCPQTLGSMLYSFHNINTFSLQQQLVAFVNWCLERPLPLLISGRFRTSGPSYQARSWWKQACGSPKETILDITSTTVLVSFSWIWPHTLEREHTLFADYLKVLRTVQGSQYMNSPILT